MAGREFPIEFRGYDRAAVAQFLHEVAEAYASALADASRRDRAAAAPGASSAPAAPAPSPAPAPAPAPAEVAGPPAMPSPHAAPPIPQAPPPGPGPFSGPATASESRAIIDAAIELSTRIVQAGHRDRLRATAEARRIVDAAKAEAQEHLARVRDHQALLAAAADDMASSEAAITSPPAPPGAAAAGAAAAAPAPADRHLHVAWPPGVAQSPRQAG